MTSLAEGLLQVPFGSALERRTSPRYHWDNLQRGADPFVIFQYTLRGEGIFAWDGRTFRVPPGHAMIAFVPEASRYFYPEGAREPWVFSWLNFYGELSLALWREIRQQAGPVFPLAAPVARRLRLLTARASRRNWADPYEASKAAYDFYLESLRHLPKKREGRPFEDAIRYFQAHYQKGIRMKEVAAHLGMSREHFTRLFLRRMGQSPAAFLRNIRLESAARLLRTTDLPVTEIAFRNGWSSAGKLDFFFKRHYRLLPKDYRRGKASRARKLPKGPGASAADSA
jgi:AraC-like DNA-binding protein